MFSEVEVSPWESDVQRPTVDPNRKTVRGDSDMQNLTELDGLMPRLVGILPLMPQLSHSGRNCRKYDTFDTLLRPLLHPFLCNIVRHILQHYY